MVAHEWLDVVPCPIAEVDDAGQLRLVMVEPATGEETLGERVGQERGWSGRPHHWPDAEPGTRVEVGLARDQAWAGLLERVRSGVAVAVDYGHRGGERPREGTLTAYREGSVVAPVPDGTLRPHGPRRHGHASTTTSSSTSARPCAGWASTAGTPPLELASRDPQAYLRRPGVLVGRGVAHRPRRVRRLLWALKRVG